MAVSPIPPGYHTVTPYLIIDGAAGAIAWYAQAFNAREVMRLSAPGGRIGHAEIEIGDSRVMLADESPTVNANAPGAFGGSPISPHLFVPEVDATMTQAAAAGATIKAPAEDKFYGERMGTLVDPFGHTWHISTHIEDVSVQEIERRMAAISAAGPSS
ncbi:MAG TPA: VOC family protein [Rhodopila sp.]|jgi:PhnB protein